MADTEKEGKTVQGYCHDEPTHSGNCGEVWFHGQLCDFVLQGTFRENANET